MKKIQDLLQRLNHLFEPENFSDYCGNGLQVEGDAEVGEIACAVTASEETIDQAIALGVKTLIVHHGLFWDKQRVSLVGGMKRRVEKLIQYKMNLIAYHLPMDAHQTIGNNWGAAIEMGWKDLQPFGLMGKQKIGVKGLVKPQPLATYLSVIEAYYGVKTRVAGRLDQEISKVALISGGAHSYLAEAIDQGVDLYMTGTGDEPMWHMAHESEVAFVSIGHSASERVGPRLLTQYLEKEGVSAQFIPDQNLF